MPRRGERLLAAHAVLVLVAASLLVTALPFRLTARVFRLSEGVAPTVEGADAERVGRVVRAVAARLPWTCTCLMQAVAGAALLRTRRQGSVVHLGVAREGDGFAAHAWLTSGDAVLTGEVGRERFTEVAAYAAVS